MTFAMAAFVVWLNRPKEKVVWHYLGVGVLLGAGTLARIDAWLTAAAFMAGGGLSRRHGRGRQAHPEADRAPRCWLRPAIGPGHDRLVVRSRPYLSLLAEEFCLMVGALSVAIVLMVALSMIRPGRLERPGRFLRTVGPWAECRDPPRRDLWASDSPLCQGAVAQSLDWADRSDTGTRRASKSTGHATTQKPPSNGWRDTRDTFPFSSESAPPRWRGSSFSARRADPRVPVLVTLIGVGAVYFYRPSITPDQFWALRRFLPVVLPLAFVFTAWAAQIRPSSLRRSAMGPVSRSQAC